MDALEQHPCSRCLAPAQFGFGTTWLCEDCYGVLGSCCMEFDGDDLFLEDRSWWESRIETKAQLRAWVPRLSRLWGSPG